MIKGQENQENQIFNRLLDAFLQNRQFENFAADLNHLDEDQISTFVEGSLSERESKPILRHLTDCGACRKITAQLARLATEFEASTEIANAPVQQPNRLQQFLQSFGLSSFDTSDEAVFAHNDSSEESDAAKEEAGEDDSKDSIEK